ncbi:MAG: trypsin-like peptidase domain-containing protein [Anaerolineales bacterium]|nr:trypsin-like peptidase domain-containing protein [Anaerolineales bacterium]
MRSKRILSTILVLITAIGLISCSGPSSEVPASTGSEPAEVEIAESKPTKETTSSMLVTALADVKSAVVQIEAQGTFVDPEGEYTGAGSGSGFIIDPSGLAITNNHVVTGAALLKVWVGGDTSKSYNAQILAVSECSDLALINIDGDGFPYLEWYRDPITVGLEVYAAGFPLGDPEFTLTKGIVSKEQANGESSWSSVNQVIEHDATINPGNSGGPLVTSDGQVVGVNYASYAEAGQFFAIGRDTTLPIIDKFKQGDDVDSLGINAYAVSNPDGSLTGIWVSSVKSGSAADDAGIKPGDLVTTLEGLNLAEDGSMATYCDIIRTQGDENPLGMEIVRFDTGETLEGQFNGRTLSVTGSFSSAGNTNNANNANSSNTDDPISNPGQFSSPNIIEVYDDGYMAITDDYEALYVEIPSNWTQINGEVWSDYWGDLYFEAADVAAAPDLDEYFSRYDYPGIRFSASEDWGAIGGYIQLLEGIRYIYEDNCTWEWRETYEDPVYEGAYEYWDCGRDADVIVIGVRPIAAPTAYLVLVQVQVSSINADFDLEIIDRIMSTFDLTDGYLP